MDLKEDLASSPVPRGGELEIEMETDTTVTQRLHEDLTASQ